MFNLRPACAEDFPAIRALIKAVQINPMGLEWQRFVVVCPPGSGEIIGCGQLKPHRDGTWELASVAVVPDWRGRGVARAIIEHLVQRYAAEHQNPSLLYLTCRASLEPLYQKFDFQTVIEADMPRYFRRISRMARFLNRAGLVDEKLLVMVRLVVLWDFPG